MQTVIQVIATGTGSLRDAIVNDRQLDRFGLFVHIQHRPGRPHGWAKIYSSRPDRRGAINLEWDADTRILIARVVNRGRARPSLIAGDLIEYLLERRRARIHSVMIVPNR